MESGHPTEPLPPGSRPSREPIIISLACNCHLNSTVESEEIVQLPSQFEQEVRDAIASLTGHDTIVINLKINSTLKPVSKQQSTGDGGNVKSDSTEPTLDQERKKNFIDAHQLERILSTIYTLVECHKAAREQLMMLQVDVLIAGFSQLPRSQSHFSRKPHQTFNTLALGGTFDHLHSGHKILLTIACWLANNTLIVGITDDELLKKKQFSNKLEGVNERIEGVKKFIKKVGPLDVNLEMPILGDIYGPTATEASIDGLLVTRETVSGADSIDEIRATNHLKPLKRYVIDVISPAESHLINDSNLKDLKISSTQIRRWLQLHEKSF